MPWDERIGRRLKLRDLYVLKTVAQLGSMGKAATQLAVSQPAVSKAISDLEGMLGVSLLDRSRQGVEPTIYGSALLKWSVAVFDNLRQGVDEIDSLADPSAGELSVGATEAMMAALVPAVIDRLSRRHPRMVFNVSQVPTVAQLSQDLRERNIDFFLAQLVMPFADDDFDVEILFEDPMFVVAATDNKWQRRRKIDPAELIDEPWALPPYDTFLGSNVRAAFRAKGLDGPRIKVRSYSLQLYTALLATGRFLTVRSASSLRLSGKRFSIKALPVDLPIRPVHVGIVTLKNRTISPAGQLFIECARRIAKQRANAH
jgi:DNA-binding transcriptional LysR family regulator